MRYLLSVLDSYLVNFVGKVSGQNLRLIQNFIMEKNMKLITKILTIAMLGFSLAINAAPPFFPMEAY